MGLALSRTVLGQREVWRYLFLEFPIRPRGCRSPEVPVLCPCSPVHQGQLMPCRGPPCAIGVPALLESSAHEPQARALCPGVSGKAAR